MEKEAKQGEVVPSGEGDGGPANVKSGPKSGRVESVLDAFLLNAHTQDGDPEVDGYERIIRQVLRAETPLAVLTPAEAVQGRDLVGVPLMLRGFLLEESEYDTGSPFFAVMDVLAPGGEELPVSCGHKKVLAQLVKLREFDQWPYRVMFAERGKSQQGTPMLELTTWKEEDFAEPPF